MSLRNSTRTHRKTDRVANDDNEREEHGENDDNNGGDGAHDEEGENVEDQGKTTKADHTDVDAPKRQNSITLRPNHDEKRSEPDSANDVGLALALPATIRQVRTIIPPTLKQKKMIKTIYEVGRKGNTVLLAGQFHEVLKGTQAALTAE